MASSNAFTSAGAENPCHSSMVEAGRAAEAEPEGWAGYPGRARAGARGTGGQGGGQGGYGEGGGGGAAGLRAGSRRVGGRDQEGNGGAEDLVAGGPEGEVEGAGEDGIALDG